MLKQRELKASKQPTSKQRRRKEKEKETQNETNDFHSARKVQQNTMSIAAELRRAPKTTPSHRYESREVPLESRAGQRWTTHATTAV